MNHIFIFDRSQLDEVIAMRPTPKGTESITRRQELEQGIMCLRSDVVLYNGTNSDIQYLLYVTEDGFRGDLWLLDVMSTDQYKKLQQIAQRMRQNAIDFPPASKLLWKW